MKYQDNPNFQILFLSLLLTDQKINETWNYKEDVFKSVLKIKLKNLMSTRQRKQSFQGNGSLSEYFWKSKHGNTMKLDENLQNTEALQGSQCVLQIHCRN